MIPQSTDKDTAGRVPALDHVGLFAHDLGAIAAQFERLGFRLTPQSQHSSLDAVTQEVVKAGSANRCAMLRRGYIELLAIVDPARDTRGLAQGLARYAGMHILAFRTERPGDMISELCAQGFSATHRDLRRVVDTPEGPRTARFSQVRTPPHELPEGVVFMLRHETPELLWQAQELTHPNGAVALAEVFVVVADPLDEVASRYARFFGCTGQRTGGQLRFDLSAGALVLLDGPAFEQRFPGLKPPVLPFPAALLVEVEDLARTASVLQGNQTAFEQRGDCLHVAPALAGGAALQFRQIP